MTTPPEDRNSPAPLSWEDLADLRAGTLTAGQEERLRIVMDRNPDLAHRMLAELAAVETEFPDPPNANDPLHVPPQVAARWQSAIAREAERRANGYRADLEDSHDMADRVGMPEPAPEDHYREEPGDDQG
ncbi:hypothetical protein GCM10009772_32210 [Pseudonocardia alni subsp. carboxydivorans]|uniref:Uncharacterized protein n=1 Tax=Pseudonocardia alni subsp. carboxydivorans TaxID=415010 RepID=A0ABU9AMC5_PSEA5